MKNEHPLPNPREKEIFWEALKFSTPESLAAYLDQACAEDQALRASVEALLKNHKKEDLLESLPDPSGVKVGDTVDRYKLFQELGEGGCGVVYLAEQQEPFRRQVALKIIKPGMDTREVLQRFEAERQSLANLQHGNIARVYDAGTTSSGVPYFVMELIRGQKLTEYCDSHRATIPQRLELFAKVCHAVHYAHLNGIIHRDIKPSNILVIEESGKPVPKVIDFGIAKAMSSEPATDNIPITAQDKLIGTPAYMSPEQAGFGGLEIDRRTDIYSLGVLLYELLIGSLPFDSEGVEQSELFKQIREIEPLCPSAKLEKVGEKERLNIAHHRQTEPTKLQGLLGLEFDRIVMKCLKKSPADRYDTVDSLVAEIELYLNKLLQDNGIVGGNGKRNRKGVWFVVLGTFFIGLVAVGMISTRKRLPDISTPEGLLDVLYTPEAYHKDIEFVHSHETKIGRMVWDWIAQQPWFKEKGIGKIVARLNDGREHSLVIEYGAVHGFEKVAPVFFEENGILKFHDLHIYELMGAKYDMDLSERILNPDEFQRRYNELNPTNGPGPI